MANQTVENLTPLLPLLEQPAFCLGWDGGLVCNAAARELAPADGNALCAWLGPAAALWETWDRENALRLTLEINGRDYSLCAEALQDGTLFLLSPVSAPDQAYGALAVASQVLRQPLADLAALLQPLAERVEDPSLVTRTAAITRQVYRLTRIAGNLADLERLRRGEYGLHLQLLDLNGFLAPLLQETQALCASAGRTLTYKLPAKSVSIQADPQLLERALLNLLSNALKFSPADTPVQFRIRDTQTHVLLQMCNVCTGGTEFLEAAFHRLDQRGQMPDPRWGIGLGLPLTEAIARLHGGTLAVETGGNNAAMVTLSLNRRRPLKTPVLESPPPFEYTGGMRRTLVELADLLPGALYQRHAL